MTLDHEEDSNSSRNCQHQGEDEIFFPAEFLDQLIFGEQVVARHHFGLSGFSLQILNTETWKLNEDFYSTLRFEMYDKTYIKTKTISIEIKTLKQCDKIQLIIGIKNSAHKSKRGSNKQFY